MSTFVIEKLPQQLEALESDPGDHSAFATEVEHLMASVSLDDVSRMSPGDRDLASLDVNFLVSAVFHGGFARADDAKDVGPCLSRVALALAAATAKIPIPSYEDVVMINPLDEDPRKFSAGADGDAEHDFYLAHRLIERCFDHAIENLERSISCLASGAVPESDPAAETLETTLDYLTAATHILTRLGRELTPAVFRRFRRYFFTISLGEQVFPGASGRYTTGLPIIEVLMADAAFRPAITPELDPANTNHLRRHYPRAGVVRLDEAVTRATCDGRSVGRILHRLSFPVAETDIARRICVQIQRFRQAHKHFVSRQIAPEELDGPVAGTGGVLDVHTYLNERITYKHIQFP